MAGLRQFLDGISRIVDQLGQLIIQNPIPFITLALGTLGSALLAHWLRRREQKVAENRAARAEHLDALKREVIRPMLVYLNEYVIPILQHKVGNIDVCFKL